MINDTGNGTIKWMLRAILMGVAIIIALLINGCGTRKSQVEISKQSVSVSESSKSESTESDKSESKKESEVVVKNDKAKESTVTKTEEIYNPDGSINKRTTTTKKETKTDKSQSNKKASESLISFKYKTFKETVLKTITIKTKEKSKSTEQSNKSWSVMIGLVLFAAVLVAGVLKWFKKI